MAQIDWPVDLPDEQYETLNYHGQSGTISSKMDKGPDKRRQRFTATVINVDLDVYFTGDELKTFLDFFRNTIGGGSERFNWEDPVTDESVEMRFRSENEPKFTLQRGDKNTDERLWNGTLELEIMPDGS